MKKLRVILILAVLAAIIGCASSDKREEGLEAVLRHYERSIKWGSYTEARMMAGEEAPAQEEVDPYKEIKVISYEVISQTIIGDFQEMDQVVEIKFYHEQQAKMRTLRDTQRWVYDQEQKTWVLKSGFPDFLSALE